MFLSGTAAKLTPITKIEQYFLPEEKPVYTKLKALFDRVVLGEESEFEDWVTRISI